MNAPPDELAAATSASYDRGPGEHLREARLAARLSMEEVSTRLHLDLHTIERLEGDDFGHLPAPTFVRGYLRSYARLLELPPGPIIEAFDRRGFAPPALIADIATHGETRSTDFWVVAVSVGIAVLVVALAAVWFRTQRGDDLPVVETTAEPALTEPAAGTPPAGNQAAPPVAYRPAPSSTPAAAVEPVRPSPGSATRVGDDAGPPGPVPARSDEVPPAPTPEADAPERMAAAPDTASPLSAPAPVNEPPEPAPTPAPAPAPAPVTTEPTAAAARAEAPAPPPSAAPAADSTPGPATSAALDTVSMRFAGDSWVEIYDANGDRLYYNLAHQGQSIEVSGVPPIRVLLGYADGVEVEYNGAPFDVSPFVSKGMARFELRP